MRKFKPLPPVERLHELFNIVPIPEDKFGKWSGLVRRVNRRGRNNKAGTLAGNRWFDSETGSIYWQVGVDGSLFRVHRIIFKMVTFVDPGDFEIDHKDINPDNNNYNNLRLAIDPGLQTSNRRKGRNNTSGVVGVSFHKPTQRWAPHLTIKGKQFQGSHSRCFIEACISRNELLTLHRPPEWQKRLVNLDSFICNCPQCLGSS